MAVNYGGMEAALRKLIDTIEATGGVSDTSDGYEPEGDPEWTDLGDAYIAACAALDVVPLVDGKREPGLWAHS
jgi:hypothetical protein